MFVSLELIAKQRRELDAAEAAWVNDVGEYDRSGDWQIDNFANAAAGLRAACHMTSGVAHAHITLARKLEKLPLVAAAFAAGEISAAHATMIANAYTPKRAASIAAAEEALVECARSRDPKDVGSVVRYLTDAVDGDGGSGNDDDQIARNTCHASETLEGRLDVRASFDHVSGQTILVALNAEMARDFQPNDPRSAPQRRADAFIHLLQSALDRGELGESHGVRPHFTVVIDIDELDGVTPAAADAVKTELRHSGFLSSAAIEILLCDCDISRAIVNGKSEILDLGRATRTVSAAQWKALVVRDRHCTTPGCTRPPDHCQAHHIRHWTHGGPTNLENLRLVCTHHHREQHRHDAQTRAPGG